MCGRMTLTTDDYDSVARELEAVVSDELRRDFRPRYNVAPADRHWILSYEDDVRRLGGATWGFFRDDGGLVVNARSERVTHSPVYRVPFLQTRCLVIADGFYEWNGPRGERQPWWFRPVEGRLLLLAGLYVDVIDPETRRPDRRFTILTTRASPDVSEIHGRMPSIVPIQLVGDWLTGSDEGVLQGMLSPRPQGSLAVQPVSKHVNRAENDDPQCIEPVPAPPKQGSLFDGF
jgi:putative SOS response-associated peptidase YedK